MSSIVTRLQAQLRDLRLQLEDLKDKLEATEQALQVRLDRPCPHCGYRNGEWR